MESTRKRRSLQSLLGGSQTRLRDSLIDRPLRWLAEARVKMKDLPKTNFQLGCRFADEGKWFDAVFRFRIVLYLQPSYPNAWFNLGSCYFRMGRHPQAIAAFKQAIRQVPTHEEAIFMLAMLDANALSPEKRPQHMPIQMVKDFFASIAADYDALEYTNRYNGGVAVHEALKSSVKGPGLNVVDLGCGTGIAAFPWRGQAGTLVGVDVSTELLAKATSATLREQKLYERTLNADISQLGDALPAHEADLVLAVNVVQFVGDLRGVMASAARLLKQGGLFALTVEPYRGQGGFGLQMETGRFGHSPAYVKQAGTAAGLTLVSDAPIALYPSSKAELLVFKKGSI